jgi:hypothetical protein
MKLPSILDVVIVLSSIVTVTRWVWTRVAGPPKDNDAA